jgi:hypothetical protein
MTHRGTNKSYKILAGKHNEASTWEALASVDDDDFKICFRGTWLLVFRDVML